MNKTTKMVLGGLGTIGALIGTWALVALFSALHSLDWNLVELARQYMVATGNLGEYETMVDYYTHIKGVEYLIAVAFFVIFPVYYKFLEPKRSSVKNV